jgi:hypothetical protein
MQRCSAQSKRSGNQCKNYAIKRWGVCRMHGARGGPKTIEGRLLCTSASLKHGFYTKRGCAERRLLKDLLNDEMKVANQKEDIFRN